MAHKIDVFYTGGGVALAEAILDDGHYAVVGNDAPEHLAIYKRVDEDEENYLPEDMISSTHFSELDGDQKTLYTEMVEELKAKGY